MANYLKKRQRGTCRQCVTEGQTELKNMTVLCSLLVNFMDLHQSANHSVIFYTINCHFKPFVLFLLPMQLSCYIQVQRNLVENWQVRKKKGESAKNIRPNSKRHTRDVKNEWLSPY